jgi:hypothetical protein
MRVHDMILGVYKITILTVDSIMLHQGFFSEENG